MDTANDNVPADELDLAEALAELYNAGLDPGCCAECAIDLATLELDLLDEFATD